MNKQKINKFLQSFIAIPMLAMAIPTAGIGQIPNNTFAILDNNRGAAIVASTITTLEDTIRQNKADAIDAYFAKYDAPLKGYGMKFVLEAEKNGIDWRLLPAIAMRESTGGKFACKSVPNSVFGYGSCKMSFSSINESIAIVAASLGGNNPNTAYHYDNKTTVQILKKYNSEIPGYSGQVVNIMKTIKDDGNKII
jgi:hypothetical protein